MPPLPALEFWFGILMSNSEPAYDEADPFKRAANLWLGS